MLPFGAMTMISIAVAAFAVGAHAAPKKRPHMAITVTSPAFKSGKAIPKKHSCDGEDVSPALSWSALPKETASVVVVMDDPDAPAGTWVHWVLFNLPGDSKGVAEGLPKSETLPNGAIQGRCWGVDEFERNGYFGPCPPPRRLHHYHFKVYALDRKLDLKPAASKHDVLITARGHILAEGELVGTYKR
jgi:Raf kinase inhibitor-like YbhB/YbcL family protein